jgi:xylono-1,5-lactonase
MKAERIFACDATLGEGASWDHQRQRLWWVDILGRRVFCGDPATGQSESWAMDIEIGAALSGPDGKRVLVLRDRVELFSPETGAREILWRSDEAPTNRFNDAGIDAHGALWIGSMDFDAAAFSGSLWRLGKGGDASQVTGGIRVVNGPVFSPDRRTLYFGDTVSGLVMTIALDPCTGLPTGQPRKHIDLGSLGGLSDGMTIDSEGCLWVARITAGRITRYKPDGTPDLTLALPVPMVTSLAFGGTDLRTLYVTTARIIFDETDLAAYPDSGSVYAFQVTTGGFEENIFIP